MGFYPFMKGDIERLTLDTGRVVRARVYDSVLSRWVVRDFEGYDLTEALMWINDKMKQVEM